MQNQSDPVIIGLSKGIRQTFNSGADFYININYTKEILIFQSNMAWYDYPSK